MTKVALIRSAAQILVIGVVVTSVIAAIAAIVVIAVAIEVIAIQIALVVSEEAKLQALIMQEIPVDVEVVAAGAEVTDKYA